MKAKIKVKLINENVQLPEISSNGDWIDLRAAKDIDIKAPQAGTQYTKDNAKYRDVTSSTYYIPLGIAIKLPKGYEAIVASRSGTPRKFSIIPSNGIGIIDGSYCGNNDEWNYICSPLNNTTIKAGDRICQFRIQLSQHATILQKLKWLFTNGVEIVKVDNLDNTDRGMNITGYN